MFDFMCLARCKWHHYIVNGFFTYLTLTLRKDIGIMWSNPQPQFSHECSRTIHLNHPPKHSLSNTLPTLASTRQWSVPLKIAPISYITMRHGQKHTILHLVTALLSRSHTSNVWALVSTLWTWEVPRRPLHQPYLPPCLSVVTFGLIPSPTSTVPLFWGKKNADHACFLRRGVLHTRDDLDNTYQLSDILFSYF